LILRCFYGATVSLDLLLILNEFNSRVLIRLDAAGGPAIALWTLAINKIAK
jgi:hypothetical protein